MSDSKIWYLYDRVTGAYLGNGTPFYDDESIGSTETPCPQYDYETELAIFVDSEWVVRDRVVEPPVVDDTESEAP